MVVYKNSMKCTIYSVQWYFIANTAFISFCQSFTDLSGCRPFVVPTGNVCFPSNLFVICGSMKRREDSEDIQRNARTPPLPPFAEFPWQQLLKEQPPLRNRRSSARGQMNRNHISCFTSIHLFPIHLSLPIISFIYLSFFFS